MDRLGDHPQRSSASIRGSSHHLISAPVNLVVPHFSYHSPTRPRSPHKRIIMLYASVLPQRNDNGPALTSAVSTTESSRNLRATFKSVMGRPDSPVRMASQSNTSASTKIQTRCVPINDRRVARVKVVRLTLDKNPLLKSVDPLPPFGDAFFFWQKDKERDQWGSKIYARLWLAPK